MKIKNSLSIIFIVSITILAGKLYGQAVAPGSNIPVAPDATPPAVTNYPGLTSMNNATKFNYVRTIVPDQPATSITGTIYHRMLTDYYDGLGRPLQSVDQRGHADGYDIVVTHTYDNLDRETYQYLPYATNIDNIYTNGNFHPNIIPDVHNFFDVNQGEEPYAKTEYDNSPLNRTVKQLAPGHSWVGSNRGISTAYLTNTAAENIRIWTIGATNTAIPTSTAAFSANQLYVTKTTDEDGKYTLEYRDKLDRVILKKVRVSGTGTAHSGFACTYYVYDILNKLRYVIPPQAVATIDGSWSVSTVSNLCYRYFYDERGRLAEKQAPDKAVEYYIYDKRDRPVMYQDGNLRAQSKWQFTIYDALDRPVVKGLVSSTATDRQTLINIIEGTTNYTAPSLYYYLRNYNLWHVYPATVTTQPGNGTILGYTFYDDYTNIPATGYGYSNQFPSVGQPCVVQPIRSNNTKNLVTETKSRVLEAATETWITKVNYYDDKGRLIQTISNNLEGGLDTISTAYYFQGKKWKTITKHRNPSAIAIPGMQDPNASLVIEDTYNRNIGTGGGNDLIWQRTQKINNGVPYNIAYYDYNESSQIRNKQFPFTNVIQDYNLRGWLNHINAVYYGMGGTPQQPTTTVTHYFEENILYDKGFASKLYNGNIAGILWRGYSPPGNTADQEAYGYTYDMLDRLSYAEYRRAQPATPASWSKNTYDYTVSNIAYDLNGNLKSMDQRNPGMSSSPIDMDKLTYTYTANSNKLVKVKDAVAVGATAGLPDFKDNIDVATEYTYDANGNLVTNGNKKITAITYNYLNKPEQITVQGQGTISYMYDADGNRLRKIVTPISGNAETYDYIGNFVYKDHALQYILNEEGRVRLLATSSNSPTGYVYDYFIKDHLGNVRTTVTANPSARHYIALHEIASANIEQLLFDNIPAVRDDKPGSTDTGDLKAAHLVATDSARRIGTSIMLKTMPGDELNINAQSYFERPPDPGKNIAQGAVVGSLFTTLMGGANYDGVPVSELPSSARTIQQVFADPNLATKIDQLAIENEDEQAPHAYMNILAFDDKMQLDPTVSRRIQVANSPLNWVQLPTGSISIGNIKKPYIWVIYVNNESIGDDVWFDNLDISHYSGGILEDNFYYPFGLTISDDAQPANTDQPVKFQSQQHENDFGINMYSFQYRFHDPETGRFWQHDPIADSFAYNSPYAFCENKVTNGVEMEGLEYVNTNLLTRAVTSITTDPGSFESKVWSAGLGIGGAVSNVITGIANAVAHPIQTAEGMAIMMGESPQQIGINYGINLSQQYSYLPDGVRSVAIFSNALTDIAMTAAPLAKAFSASKIGFNIRTNTGLGLKENTTIFRSISEAEAKSISTTGRLSFGEGMQVKQFWMTRDGLNNFNNTDFANGFNLQLRVPRSLIGEGKAINTSVQVDSHLGTTGTIDNANGLQQVNDNIQSYDITPQ